MAMGNKNFIDGLEILEIHHSEIELSKMWEFYRYLASCNSSINLMSSKDLEDWEVFVERHILDSLSITPQL